MFSKESLALIDTIMYCDGVMDEEIIINRNEETGETEYIRFDDFIENVFYDNGVFRTSSDQLGYPNDLKQVIEAILNDPELCKLKVVATSETYKADKKLSDTSGALSLCLYDESTSDIVVLYAGDYYSR